MPNKIVVRGSEERINEVATFNLWQVIASNTSADGSTLWQNLASAFPAFCNDAPLLDVAGSSATGADGTALILLTEFTCPGGLVFSYPVNVVATPRSSSPFFLTLTHGIGKLVATGQSEVEITVCAWDTNGVAAPGVEFDWRCRVVANTIIE